MTAGIRAPRIKPKAVPLQMIFQADKEYSTSSSAKHPRNKKRPANGHVRWYSSVSAALRLLHEEHETSQDVNALNQTSQLVTHAQAGSPACIPLRGRHRGHTRTQVLSHSLYEPTRTNAAAQSTKNAHDVVQMEKQEQTDPSSSRRGKEQVRTETSRQQILHSPSGDVTGRARTGCTSCSC